MVARRPRLRRGRPIRPAHQVVGAQRARRAHRPVLDVAPALELQHGRGILPGPGHGPRRGRAGRRGRRLPRAHGPRPDLVVGRPGPRPGHGRRAGQPRRPGLRGEDFLHGAVVDFVDLQWWPIFNVADAAIVVGAGLLAWKALRASEPDPGEEEGSRPSAGADET
ncbi:MAG: hypothetical protein GEV08_11550 [Acidimicrobiia bacterium]|nr:hypothetical protein [Acidimicrobiia bacterium]